MAVKKRQAKKRVVAQTLVPVITHHLLSRVESLADRLTALIAEFEDVANQVDSSLGVLRGQNHPEGWLEIVEIGDEEP